MTNRGFVRSYSGGVDRSRPRAELLLAAFCAREVRQAVYLEICADGCTQLSRLLIKRRFVLSAR